MAPSRLQAEAAQKAIPPSRRGAITKPKPKPKPKTKTKASAIPTTPRAPRPPQPSPTPAPPPTRTLPARAARNPLITSSSPRLPPPPEEVDYKTPIECTSQRCRAPTVHLHPPGLQWYRPQPWFAVRCRGYANVGEGDEDGDGAQEQGGLQQGPSRGGVASREAEALGQDGDGAGAPSSEPLGNERQAPVIQRRGAVADYVAVVADDDDIEVGSGMAGVNDLPAPRAVFGENAGEGMLDINDHASGNAEALADEYRDFLAEFGNGNTRNNNLPSETLATGILNDFDNLPNRPNAETNTPRPSAPVFCNDLRTPHPQTSTDTPNVLPATGTSSSFQPVNQAAQTLTPQKETGESSQAGQIQDTHESGDGTPETIRLFTPESDNDRGAGPRAIHWGGGGGNNHQNPGSTQNDGNAHQSAESVPPTSSHESQDENPVAALEGLDEPHPTEGEVEGIMNEMFGAGPSAENGVAENGLFDFEADW